MSCLAKNMKTIIKSIIKIEDSEKAQEDQEQTMWRGSLQQSNISFELVLNRRSPSLFPEALGFCFLLFILFVVYSV